MNTPKHRSTRVVAASEGNGSEHKRTLPNKKTARKLHGGYPKGDVRHWLSRVKKEDSPDFGIQIHFRGKRHRFPLKTPNKETAARKALAIYQNLVATGWDAVLAEHKASAVKPSPGGTVGDLIRAVSNLANVRARTLSGNVSTFRRIVADVQGIDSSASRFASKGEGRASWLAAVDAVRLAQLTPDRIEAWKLRFVSDRSKHGEVKARAARNSANTMLRMGKSLFAKRLLRFIASQVELPSPLPFDGVGLFPRQSMRYTSTLDVEAILRLASEELANNDSEAFKAFLVCLFGGLRRNEADKLRWSSIDLKLGVVRVESQIDFAPKAETSLSDIPIEPEVCAILQTIRSNEPKAVYLLAGEAVKANATYANYRADSTFQRLASWLRTHGVPDRCPLHTLRKEAGSLVCQKKGLFAASRFLRHADVAITAQHYAAQKERVTVGLGTLLAASSTGPETH